MKIKKLFCPNSQNYKKNSVASVAQFNLKTQNLFDHFLKQKNQRNNYRSQNKRHQNEQGTQTRFRKQPKKMKQPLSQRNILRFPKSLKKTKKVKLASGPGLARRNKKQSSAETSIANHRTSALGQLPSEENMNFINLLPPIRKNKFFKVGALSFVKKLEKSKKEAIKGMKKKKEEVQSGKMHPLNIHEMLHKLRKPFRAKPETVHKRKAMESRGVRREKEHEEALKRQKDSFVGLWRQMKKSPFYFENHLNIFNE